MASYRWLNLPNGEVAVRSHFLRSVFIEFNPTALEFGHNVFPYSEPVLESLIPTVSAVIRRIPALVLSRRPSILLRGGHSRLSELHLAGDFVFPTQQALDACLRNLRRSWNWRLNRKRNDYYPTSLYVEQTHWKLVAYDKGVEAEDNQPRWPKWVKDRARLRLRVEVRIKRQDLRKLGDRLQRHYTDLPPLDLSRTRDWEAWVYPLVYDYYLARFRSIHRHARLDSEAVPLYRFLEKYGARPVTPRVRPRA